MRLLFNTIMLEVNRWTAEKRLTFPLIDLLEPLRRAGFAELEIWQYHVSRLGPDELDGLAERLRSLDMRAMVLGAYPLLHLQDAQAERAAAELDRLVACAHLLGATTFKIFPGCLASARADAHAWNRSLRRLKDLAAILAGLDLGLTLETHANTLCDSLESTKRLLDDLRHPPNVGLCFQPYADQDTDAALAMYDALRPAIRHLHLQNRSRADNACTLLAEGDWIDGRRFLAHVKQSGFAGLLCLEFTAGLFPPQGQSFDPQVVIDHATKDRDFVLRVWDAQN